MTGSEWCNCCRPAHLEMTSKWKKLAVLLATTMPTDRNGLSCLPFCTEWWDAGVVMCLGQGADLHMAQLMPLLLTLAPVNPDWFYLPGFTFLVPAYPGGPKQNPRGP